MNRTVLKWAGVVAMGIAAAGQSGDALACMPLGSGETGARGGSDKVGQLMSDGANVAWFEWSDAEGGFVQVQRWFDPYLAQLPIQPDEVDATDWLQAQGLLGGESGLACGGWGGTGDPVMPLVTVRPGPAVPRAGGMLGRILGGVGGGGAGRLILRIPTLTYPFDIPVQGPCNADLADAEACQSIRGAVGVASVVFRSWNFTALFEDGLRTDYQAMNLWASECGIRVTDRRCE